MDSMRVSTYIKACQSRGGLKEEMSLTFAMALFSVGLGAVFFAPKSRFILTSRCRQKQEVAKLELLVWLRAYLELATEDFRLSVKICIQYLTLTQFRANWK